MSTPRAFQEVSVAVLGRQTMAQRFPDEYMIANNLRIPRLVQWAMNLTALSQYHNLYFTAYGVSIHVFVPQGPQQTLLPEAALLLEPPQSEDGRRIGGRMTHGLNGHSINNLMIGNLGNEEIVLCACDDGDVYAYYTQAVANAVRQVSESFEPLKPFFHENVGISCWGLAIHEKSRLVAVSSNYHEVQVFAFALSDGEEEPSTPSTADSSRETDEPFSTPLPIVRFPVYQITQQLRSDEQKLQRRRNFRLILPLTDMGDNIPSIAFSSDVYGRAETLIASDIRGGLWFLSLWKDRWKRLPTVSEETYSHLEPLGWAVTVLPQEFFRPTRTMFQTYGCKEDWAVRNWKIDVSPSVAFVRDITIWHEFLAEPDDIEAEIHREDLEDEDEEDFWEAQSSPQQDDDDEDEDDDEEDDEMSDTDRPETSPPGSQNQHLQAHGYLAVPTVDRTQHYPWQAPARRKTRFPSSLVGSSGSKPQKVSNRFISEFVTDDSIIFHANRHDITLIPSTDFEPCTYCNNLLRQDVPHDIWFPQALVHYNRLNMLATIPELSLVLIASQVGRVALLTLTRPVYKSATLYGSISFRVDLVLPLGTEENVEMIRPSNGLLGIAVSPMPGTRGKNKMEPKRFRLLMHYYDHTILSYVISREEETGNVVLF